MTLADIQADLYQRLNYASTPAAAVVSRLLVFVNQRYRRLLSMPGMSRLRDANTTFVTAAGTAQYTLATSIQQIRAVYDATNQRRLTQRSLDWLRGVDPGLISTANTGEAWIPVTETATHAWTIQVWPTPSSIVTYNVDYTAALTDLANPTDEPLLPADFHYLLGVGARLDEYEKIEDKRYAIVARDWDEGVRRLINYVQNNADYIAVPGGRPVAWSSLGPWFPAGS